VITQLNQGFSVADWNPDDSFPFSPPQTAYPEAIEDERRHFLVNSCAGIAWTESWKFRYDGLRQGWVVEGDISGEMTRVAYEDQRYLTDDGQISFVMRAGSTPSVDGWTGRFRVAEGALAADGDNDKDSQGVREINFDLPGDPVVVYGNMAGEQVPWVIVAAQAADTVMRIKPDTAEIDRIWD
jgi:hypothetical protein